MHRLRPSPYLLAAALLSCAASAPAAAQSALPERRLAPELSYSAGRAPAAPLTASQADRLLLQNGRTMRTIGLGLLFGGALGLAHTVKRVECGSSKRVNPAFSVGLVSVTLGAGLTIGGGWRVRRSGAHEPRSIGRAMLLGAGTALLTSVTSMLLTLPGKPFACSEF